MNDFNIPAVSSSTVYKFNIPPMNRKLFLCAEHKGVTIKCGDCIFVTRHGDDSAPAKFSYWPIEVVGKIKIKVTGDIKNLYFSYSDTQPRQFY
jgi:hypothetical protein